ALNKGLESLIVSICRQLLFVIPVAYIFVQMVLNGSNINIIWYTFIMSETLSLLISLFFMRNVNKKTIQAM
ncbi:MAG: MATE family efflux transporter, partial [Floccifex sp.]|nr:MATE family efflux transporter [Floccifex sp.]